MRKIYRNFISNKDVIELKKLKENKSIRILEEENYVVNKVIKQLQDDFDFEIKKESYYRLEPTADHGHEWHVDTGSSNHMMWCQVGCSIMLESSCDGGSTYYNIDGEIIEVDRNVYDLIAHTSDVLHKVDPPKGHRLVFLIFI